jgi:hypothetical protein
MLIAHCRRFQPNLLLVREPCAFSSVFNRDEDTGFLKPCVYASLSTNYSSGLVHLDQTAHNHCSRSVDVRVFPVKRVSSSPSDTDDAVSASDSDTPAFVHRHRMLPHTMPPSWRECIDALLSPMIREPKRGPRR